MTIELNFEKVGTRYPSSLSPERYVAECFSNGGQEKNPLAMFYLLYNGFDEIKGAFLPFEKDNGHIPILIKYMVKNLKELSKKKGSFEHVVPLTDDLKKKKNINAFIKNGYQKNGGNSLYRNYN